MYKKILIIVLILSSVLFTACEPAQKPVAPDDPSVTNSECVRPESDNSYSWSYDSCVDVSTTVYTVTITVDDEITNHTEVGASGSAVVINGIGSASYRMWQEGKGLLPVEIVSISPADDIGIVPGDSVILKTSDLKAMALPTGATTVFICNLDTEVLSPVQNMQVLTTNRLVYELDDCRMISPTYKK